MKYIASNVLCKGFAICRGFITPHDNYFYNPEDAFVDTKYTQIFYLIEGNGYLSYNNDKVMTYDNGSLSINPSYREVIDGHLKTGSTLMIDLRNYRGEAFSFVSGDKGAGWICINPIPAGKLFDSSLILGGTTRTIIGDGREHVIICAKGSITINGNPLNIFNYARVLEGKTAEIVIPSDSEAIYLTR
jgi:hypothetical protein